MVKYIFKKAFLWLPKVLGICIFKIVSGCGVTVRKLSCMSIGDHPTEVVVRIWAVGRMAGYFLYKCTRCQYCALAKKILFPRLPSQTRYLLAKSSPCPGIVLKRVKCQRQDICMYCNTHKYVHTRVPGFFLSSILGSQSI
jgi:hypothetical protein